MYGRQHKTIFQFKCKNNTYSHEKVSKEILSVDTAFLRVSGLFTSKFIINFLFHYFEIHMKK